MSRWPRLGLAVAALALPCLAQEAPPFTVTRFAENPLIRPEMLPDDPVININGPSVIRAPSWLPHPLGTYYLYFANHRGPDLHLAVASSLHGPWTIVRPGPGSVRDVAALNGETIDSKSHAASPDVLVDDERREIRMYFHFRLPKLGHVSTVAVSKDGLHFRIQPGTIGEPYLRVFRYQGWYYLIDRTGELLRSKDGLKDFEVGSTHVYTATYDGDAELRHTGLRLVGDTLQIFFTRVGDAPESIYVCSMPLKGDWKSWTPGKPALVLAPAETYEGADLPIVASEKGDAKGRERALRDPYLFDENGHTYLFYSVAGEYGLAAAELKERPDQASSIRP